MSGSSPFGQVHFSSGQRHFIALNFINKHLELTTLDIVKEGSKKSMIVPQVTSLTILKKKVRRFRHAVKFKKLGKVEFRISVQGLETM